MSPKPPTVVMLAGLQGSGKTTAAGKLARLLKSQGLQPLLVGADLQRPAAVEQLRVLAGRVDVPFYSRADRSGQRRARRASKKPQRLGRNIVIVDTAGRLQIDIELMDELRDIRDAVQPHNTLLVVDAMTGQEAVNVAEAFHEAVGLDGVILTKIDGDARGGAALSVKEVVGKPILFAGTGEKLDEFEAFHPDRMASRILGMGDVLTLIEKAEAAFDDDAEAQRAEEIVREGTFTLEDFLEQMQQVKKMGPLQNVLGMLPGMPKEMRNAEIDDREIARVEAIIRSMTPDERRKPDLDQRLAPGPHRQGCGREHRRGQQPAEAVQAGAADDEGLWAAMMRKGKKGKRREDADGRLSRDLTEHSLAEPRPSLRLAAVRSQALAPPGTPGVRVAVKIRLMRVGKKKQPTLPRRRRRRAQPARRPVHRDPRPVRAAPGAVGRARSTPTARCTG